VTNKKQQHFCHLFGNFSIIITENKVLGFALLNNLIKIFIDFFYAEHAKMKLCYRHFLFLNCNSLQNDQKSKRRISSTIEANQVEVTEVARPGNDYFLSIIKTVWLGKE